MDGAGRERAGGQALVEFVVGVAVVVMFLVIAPVLGKLLQIRMKTTEAANYVLWRQMRGTALRDAQMASEEVAKRFFSGQGVAIKTEQGIFAANEGWRTDSGLFMVESGAVRVRSNAGDDGSFKPLREAAHSLSLSTDGLMTSSVSVRLASLPEYSWLPRAMNMTQSFSGIGGAWTADSPQMIKDKLNHASFLHPYPQSQKPLMRTVNSIMRPLFGEKKVTTDLVLPDVVPKDRLVKYVE